MGESLDMMVYPHRFGRKMWAMPLRVLPVLIVNGFFLLLSGSLFFSFFIGSILFIILMVGSNIKLKLLNEPLVFTDLTLCSAFIKHPAFYLQAVPVKARFFVITGFMSLFFILFYAWSYNILIRFEGGAVALFSALLLWHLLKKHSRPGYAPPDLWKDVRDIGLLPTVMLYACRWKRECSLPIQFEPERPYVSGAPEAVIIIQCESFADPSCLSGEWKTLPELNHSRDEALLWGDLEPSGLGAYTMRSEYGVLCGGNDQILSYRQFDPFLSAESMASHALPCRLKAFYHKALFLHPYDLRFYGRDKLMPALGFTDIVGGKHFQKSDYYGPYVSDKALTKFLLDYLHRNQKFLAYCVTIENHGPWGKGRLGKKTGAEAWYEHARNGDFMLGALRDAIKASGKDVMLVFFGDHRPALEKLPPIKGLERTTPYVVLRPNAGITLKNPNEPVALTPAELHEAIIEIVSSGSENSLTGKANQLDEKAHNLASS